MVQDFVIADFWWLPLLALASAAVRRLAAARGWSERGSAALVIGVDAAALLFAVLVCAGLWSLPPDARGIDRVVATWIPGLPLQLQDGRYAPFQVDWSLHLDPLGAGLALGLTAAALFVGLLPARRAAASPNLLVASLLLLVLAGSVVTVLVAWVGFGLSLGAWHSERRAILTARAGDWLFVGGMVLAAGVYGTADLGAMRAAAASLPAGSPQAGLATAAAGLLLAAIVARVVQVPLHPAPVATRRGAATWLSAATVLAAGGYVVVRNAALFQVMGR